MDHKAACEQMGISPTELTPTQRFKTLGQRIFSLPHTVKPLNVEGIVGGIERLASVKTRGGFIIEIMTEEPYTPGSLIPRHLASITAQWTHENGRRLPVEYAKLHDLQSAEHHLDLLEQTIAEAELAVANEGFISNEEMERRAGINSAVSAAG